MHIFPVLALLAVSVASAAEPLSPIDTVRYDSQGRFLVNDQPFFPVVLYDAPTDDETLAQLRDSGFNVLTCRLDACDALLRQGFYSAIHPGKNPLERFSGVLFVLGTDSPALYFKKNLLQQVAEANAKVSAVVPNRPIANAIGYWEDEPEGVFNGKLPSKENYDNLVAAIDVSAPYLYPVPYQPVASVGDAVARARTATSGKKPVIPILQLFAWKAEDRYPTAAELRCMAFLALVEGANGIGYYSYGHVTGRPKTTIAAAQPELWQSVKNLNCDIVAIGPRLLTGETARGISLMEKNAAIRIKAIRDTNGLLTVVVNSSTAEQEVRLAGLVNTTTGSLVLESRQATVFDNDALVLRLQPFGVEIIRNAASR